MFSIYAVRLTVDESYLGSFDFPVLHCADNASKMNGNRDLKRAMRILQPIRRWRDSRLR